MLMKLDFFHNMMINNVVIHFSRQAVFSFLHIEGITLGSGKEIDEVARGANSMGIDGIGDVNRTSWGVWSRFYSWVSSKGRSQEWDQEVRIKISSDMELTKDLLESNTGLKCTLIYFTQFNNSFDVLINHIPCNTTWSECSKMHINT